MADSLLKRIELAVRGWFNSRAGDAERDPVLVESPSSVIPPERVNRILLLRQDRIGDVIVSTPILRALRRAFPAATIDMVLSKNNIAVRQAVEEYVDNIHLFQKSIIDLLLLRRRLRRASYDVVLDLMDNASSTSALLIGGARPVYAIGVDKVNRRVYTHVVPLADQSRVHIVERISRLTWPLNIAISGDDLHLAFPLTEKQINRAQQIVARKQGEIILAVNVSGSDVHRMYPEEKMINVLERLSALLRSTKDYQQVSLRILSAPQHVEMANRIAQTIGIQRIPPETSYAQFAACVAVCDMLLTPDTSIVHVAAAWKIPSTVLFSQDQRGLLPWTPYQSPCWPCITQDGALEAIAVDEVVEAAEAMIRSTVMRNSSDA